MSDIKIKCVDQTLTFVNAPIIASGGVIEDRVVFDFCPLWNGYVKTAVFYRDKTEVYYKLLEADDSCDIPAEVLASSGIVYIGVFGVKDESRRTSELLAYSISEGAVLNIAPTVDVYAQILEALANTKIVSGRITEKGHLVFTKQDGSEVDVGSGISLTDEQVNTALTEWLEMNAEQTQLTTINAAVITKIREMHKKGLIRFWVGTKAEYAAITAEDNVFYVLTDEDPLTDIQSKVNGLDIQITAAGTLLNTVGEEVATLREDVSTLKTNGADTLTDNDNGWTVCKLASGALMAWQSDLTVTTNSFTVTLPTDLSLDLPWYYNATPMVGQSTNYGRYLSGSTISDRKLTVQLLGIGTTSVTTVNYTCFVCGRWK